MYTVSRVSRRLQHIMASLRANRLVTLNETTLSERSCIVLCCDVFSDTQAASTQHDYETSPLPLCRSSRVCVCVRAYWKPPKSCKSFRAGALLRRFSHVFRALALGRQLSYHFFFRRSAVEYRVLYLRCDFFPIPLYTEGATMSIDTLA